MRSLFLDSCRGDHKPDTLDIFTGGIAGGLVAHIIVQRPTVIGDLGGPIGTFGVPSMEAVTPVPATGAPEVSRGGQ